MQAGTLDPNLEAGCRHSNFSPAHINEVCLSTILGGTSSPSKHALRFLARQPILDGDREVVGYERYARGWGERHGAPRALIFPVGL